MTEEQYAVKIGEKVGLGITKIECPICSIKGNIREGQCLASIGDMESILFCPGCNTEIKLEVTFY